MGALLDVSPAEKPLTKTCTAKLVALSFILCFLIRLAILDPLGIVTATATFMGNERATVTHVVIMQFRDDVSPEVIEWANARMVNLQDDCVHPYTGAPYIESIGGGDAPEAFKGEHTHAFILRFHTPGEQDYFTHQDPIHMEFQKDIKPLTKRMVFLNYIDD